MTKKERLLKMHLKMRSKCYTAYRVEEIPNGMCRIIATYFVEHGNLMQDSNIKQKEVTFCPSKYKEGIEKDLKQQILNTKNRLLKMMFSVGATEANAYAVVRQKMQKVL